LNKFFTSSTRATKRLFIDQGDDYPLAPLCNAFKKGIKTPETAFLSDPNLEQTEEERLTQWEEEVCRLYQNGKKDIARNAFDRCLKEHRSYTDYDDFLLSKGLIKKEESPVEKKEVVEQQKRPEILPAVAKAAESSQKSDVLQKEKAVSRAANKKPVASSQPKQEDKGKQAAAPKAKPKETTASLSRKPVSFASTNKKSNSTLPFGPLVRSPAFFNPSPNSRVTGITEGRELLQAAASTVPARVPETDPVYQRMKGFLDNVFSKSADTALDRYFSCKDESCFLIMMSKDEAKLKAFRRYLEEHESSLSQWFPLQKLFEIAPDGTKSRFETMARNPVGLQLLELIFSLVPIDRDVRSIFTTMCQVFFTDLKGLNWSEVTAENHFLMHLAGSAEGISLFQTIVDSSFFPGMKLQDKSGNTFLHWAIEINREDLASIIISSRHAALAGGDRIIPGANPKVIFRVANKLNLTPLDLAKSKNAENLIPLLEAREKRILEAEQRKASRWSPYPNLQLQPVSRVLFPGDDLDQVLRELENKGPS
ncbi:hypothetical protein, partial [Legionella genomosp. 1]|uniref:hypothetical protein n=1 Tax=Legionella genomosp. 1 TaxID=1093625 RepID=UPI0013EF7ECB